MENTSRNMNKDRGKEENTSLESKGENLVSKSNLDPQQSLILHIRRSRTSTSCSELILPEVQRFHNSIPKHIITFDEKYILRCLELIHVCALRASARNFASEVEISPIDASTSAEIKVPNSCNMAQLAMKCPLASSDEWNIGTVSNSQSMINILKSPLLQQFNSSDYDVHLGKTRLLDVGKPYYSDPLESRQESSRTPSHNLRKEHKRLISMSSTYTSCSDQSSSSISVSSFQAMLQCTWNDGLPNHVFTVDDKREVYVANLLNLESYDDKALDYVYSFHSRKTGKKECDIHELEWEIGKMQVSTSITFCPNSNSEIKETRFILSVPNDNPSVEMQTSNHNLKKNKRLARKVTNVFRSKWDSKFGGSNPISENTLWEPSEDVPNLESAAIIVKEMSKSDSVGGLGGWGLKFLRRNNASLETLMPSECTRNTSEFSTSINVLIPAGLHGGPRSKVGGPSSLTERWISGGQCDCGGWDTGCPLTILNTKSSKSNFMYPEDNSGECKSVDFYMQGSKQDVAVMKMVNIHKGLYYIHFQSSLSSLQSFAIATAIIHSNNPVLIGI
ncbi:hypothetical protein ACJIZ3_017092 [Penstemon smallii]|uniref:Uncharacterized protein n=1 Tax=Penstemon smallii TaxID=265156 RepID=A0ABD3SUK5_9LAMI